jgi:hypothetical protein
MREETCDLDCLLCDEGICERTGEKAEELCDEFKPYA